MSDQQAIRILKKGNIDGLAALVQRYQVKAVQAALFITCDRQLAEDVVQDAFLQVHRKITQFDDSRPFSPWFLRIVINAAKKAVTKQGRFVSLAAQEDGNSAAEWLIDPTKGPESLSETEETREQVWRAIQQLTADQREAVVMRYFLGSKESELVRELGRPSTTIKWWLHAARKRLRELLRPVQRGRFEKEEVGHE
ncbi:MAG: RNA polymerase sigma factor [Anaerolineaceae bacterium]|nr:RNA polymerase sigma factor [Anaerolineaceae bacterium]